MRAPFEIDAGQAWGDHLGAGVRVAVVDSGIEADHPELAGAVHGGVEVQMTGENEAEVMPVEQVVDDYGHGTACAGIIHRLAPDAELYSIKVLGASCSGRGEAFLRGLEWAIDNQMDVVNLSLGTTNRRLMADFYKLVDQAYYAHCILVAAANNVPPPSIPSIMSSLVSVDCGDFADHENFAFKPGELIEMVAHGTNVNAPWLGGTYRRVTGTSFATPRLTGLIARLRGRYPLMPLFQVKTVLCSLARHSTPKHRRTHERGARGLRAFRATSYA